MTNNYWPVLKLSSPISLQPLFLFPLSDFSTLQEHKIVEGSKIHLSVRKQGNGTSGGNPDDFFKLLREFLREHFTEQDTEQVIQKFREVCNRLLLFF